MAEFTGGFGWGYDGVDLFAPTRCYGRPDEFRRFVDAAHGVGMGVILDVVYNHLGPDGNYLKKFSPAYFTNRYENDWGDAINFDGPDSGPVREFYITNAEYWIDEYHLDGLRLDATQQIFDPSESHIVREVVSSARSAAAGRRLLIVGENEPQESKYVRPPKKAASGLDALWNDDFHHSMVVALTGRYEAYYTDYRGTPQECISAYKYGYLYQGQEYSWQRKRRGTGALDLDPSRFVVFLAKSRSGGQLRAREAAPAIEPAGEISRAYSGIAALAEYSDAVPGAGIRIDGAVPVLRGPLSGACGGGSKGRVEFLSQFRSLGRPEMKKRLADPSDHSVFTRCKLDHEERERNREVYALHRDLIALRRNDSCFRFAASRRSLDGAVISPEAFVVRYFGAHCDDRLLLVNLGSDLHLRSAPEPLLGPPEESQWEMMWSSEDPTYGGLGTYPPETGKEWVLPAFSALVMAARRTRTTVEIDEN